MQTPDLPEVIEQPGPAMPAPEQATKRRSGSDQRQMSVVKPIRFTDAELAEAEALAAAEGKGVEDYLRDTALQPPPQSEDRPRATGRHPVKYLRMTPEQAQVIDDLAQAASLSFGSYVRSRGLKRPVTLTTRRPPIESDELRRLAWEHGRAASNVYQLLRDLRFGPGVSPIDGKECIAAMQAAAEAFTRALGCAPRPRGAR